MYGTRVGGVTPHAYGLQVTVLVPSATPTQPVNEGDLLKLITTAPYSAAPCADGDPVQLKAIHGGVTDDTTPVGCHLYGFSRVDKFKFTGAEPTIGASVVAAGNGVVKVSPENNGTFVLFVDSSRNIVEVAMP
ncbi:hypothetical protein H1164_13945 [Thermoactinomyces daqus]|uniref:Uncharacterized protein n=1 Tax=Thermoactinomyces daqus TaxID=1329516 RepID=A0A7W2AI87_9BACL|nr:hypothetical protein [Thermoactinomyces daqus]MBA4543987.1 hypothetical protein [Thermoactinomyces daqus]